MSAGGDQRKRQALGRGLEALLPAPPSATSYGEKSVFRCAIEKIVPQPSQPRQHFDAEALEELSASIRDEGLLQPLVVRRSAPGADTFVIIAGERRWRAAQKAGLHELLVIVKDVSPSKAFELALIENVQREDLNPVELAEGLGRLLKDHGYTQEELGERIGKDRTTIANSLRLLKLPERVRAKIISGELTEGHARALLGAGEGPAIEDLAERVVRGHLSVRKTEELVRARVKPQRDASGEGKKPDTQRSRSAIVRDLEQQLTRALGTKVEVRDEGNRGEIAIPYANLDALDGVLERLIGRE